LLVVVLVVEEEPVMPIDMVAVLIHLVLILGLVPLLVVVMVLTIKILEQQQQDYLELVEEVVAEHISMESVMVVMVDLES
tara:strand:+ start:182 stop:421 length:240 start_codon:yes stop_codon:yes gene_type:complete